MRGFLISDTEAQRRGSYDDSREDRRFKKSLRLCVIMVLLCAACLPESTVPTIEPTATRTPFPTLPPRPTATDILPTLSPTEPFTPQPTSETAPNGEIGIRASSVDVRQSPGTAGEVIRTLRGVAPVRIVGRTDEYQWLEVTLPDGVSGWVLASAVESDLNFNTLAVTGIAENLPGVAIEPTPLPDASVKANAGGLRVRSEPGLVGTVYSNLDAFDPLAVLARTFDDQWLQVQTAQGVVGWVATQYVDLNMSLRDVPATHQTVFATPTPLPSSPYAGTVSNVLPALQQIVLRGREIGNRPDVFSKVGDGLTTSAHFFTPIGRGEFNLGEFTQLQEVITFYSATPARDGNSFVNPSLASGSGWTTASVLNPALANTELCESGETPLACEYRIVKPAVAFIMLGSNDVELFDATTFRANMDRIAQITLENGIVPIISTMPERDGYDVAPYNRALQELSLQYGLPLWDYWRVLQTAPNNGMAEDGVFPSAPAPDNPAASADFRVQNLSYGYNIRNLTGLIALDTVWREIISAPS